MTSQHEETVQQNQATAFDHQNNSRPELKVTVLPAVHTQKFVLENLKQLRERIAKDVREFDQKDLPEDLQTEIPKLAVLLQRIERLVLNTNQPKKLGALNSLACSLEVALSSLFQKKLTKEFTRQIRLDVEQEVIGYEQPPVLRLFVSHFSYIWHTKSVRLSVIYGLTWSFIIMFGGLFSLALFQYIVYSSNADAVKIEALIDEQQKKVEDLKTQLEGVTTQVAKKLIPANAPIIPDLARRIKRAEKRVKDLEKEQTDQMPKRSPLSQSVLANVDTGFSKTLSQILWVAAAGTLGSIVSILIRVIGKSYDQEAYYDRLTPIFIGFFKPVIGASFGVLFLAFIKAEVISTPLIPDARKPVISQPTVNASKPANSEPTVKTSDNSETKTGFFLFSVAFIVGFSERLAQDTISKLEGGSSASNKEGKG